MTRRLARSSRWRAWLALGGFCLLGGCSSDGAAPERQRIVLITLDTLRYDSFRRGRPLQTDMPRTSVFAARGHVFTRYYSVSPMTQPSHASLFTGLQPWEHAVLSNGDLLGDRQLTLAERLRENGFETTAVVASFPLDPRFGFAQGFDHYRSDFRQDYGLEAWADQAVGEAFYSLADAVVEEALGRLEAARAPRQFFWFHLFDPHEPYGDTQGVGYRIWQLERLESEGSPLLATSIQLARKLYGLDVNSLDGLLGRLLDRLESQAAEWETHVVVVSDHGESFGENGVYGHGTRVSAEQVRVPLIIVSPRLEPALRRDVVGTVDVTATILALAGLDFSDLRGRDLSVVLGDGEGTASGVGFAREGEGQADARFFVVRDGVHYTEGPQGLVRSGRREQPVEGPAGAGILELFASWEELVRAAPVERLVDEGTLEGLRALGYVESAAPE
jgi:arylsulfatase A-like enzyme